MQEKQNVSSNTVSTTDPEEPSQFGRDEIFKHLKSTAQPSISMGTIRDIDYPFPPLAEQHRIVAKIDQLMARCDELEKLRSDRTHALITVHTTAIARLLTAKDSDDFSTAWHFITQHFGGLYSVKATVAELRKTILQLAVMGKLVPQDPNDEPASELLKAIELEKQRLVKEGKIKSSKPLPEILHDKLPYQLPLSWEWVRLGNITTLQNGFAFKSENYISQGIKLIRNVNIGHGSVDHKNIAYYPDSEWGKFKDFELSQGDILISLDRPIISTGLKIAVLKENDVPSLLVQRVGRIEVEFLRVNPGKITRPVNGKVEKTSK
jgi:type I restriction enzyme S subunit